MRIVYGYDQALPNRGADSEQVMSTVAAVSRAGAELDLLTVQPAREPSSTEALKAHYQVTGPFRIEQLGPPVPVVPGGRVVVKAVHAARVARQGRQRDALVHTRNFPTVVSSVAGGLPVLYDTYRPWPEQYPSVRPVFRTLLQRRNLLGVVVHSHHAAASFLGLGADHKVAVIHNGHDPARMEPRLGKRQARARLGLAVDVPIVTYTGRVDPEKGLGVVLEIARRCPEVRFLLVGSRVGARGDGPLQRAGRDIPNLEFVPWQPYDKFVPYLYAADILIAPPTLAPLQRVGTTVLPMKIYQYLAAGRVILAPEAPDLVEILRHEDNAVLVPPGDVAASVAAVRQIIGAPDFAAKVAERALSSAASLTWDARARRILRFLRDRVGDRLSSRALEG